MKQYINIFSVDLEDWYHSSPEGQSIITKDFRILDPTERILKLLKQTNNFGTFFVVGEIAQRHPQLIKEIAKQGHEIACHSFHHQFIFRKSPKQFENDLKKTVSLLEDLIHKKVIGFRAPAWSVDKIKTPWFWEILAKNNIKYSSSVFPFKTYLYGDNNAYRFSNIIDSVIEIPPSTIEIFNKRIPFSGGFYFRSFPLSFINYFTKKINRKNNPVVFYIHPWEIDPNHPKIPLSKMETFIHNHNLKRTYSKLDKLLSNNSLTSFKRFLHFD
jgi:polysaccharide deacetylase family protein (PEP-CTERM system associated)